MYDPKHNRYFLNTYGHSITTSGHLNDAWRAVPFKENIVDVKFSNRGCRFGPLDCVHARFKEILTAIEDCENCNFATIVWKVDHAYDAFIECFQLLDDYKLRSQLKRLISPHRLSKGTGKQLYNALVKVDKKTSQPGEELKKTAFINTLVSFQPRIAKAGIQGIEVSAEIQAQIDKREKQQAKGAGP